MYQGHHQDGSSIQRHSAGSHYPFVVRIQEHAHMQEGWADVLHPHGFIRRSFRFTVGVKAERLEAYRRAYDAADELANEWRAAQ